MARTAVKTVLINPEISYWYGQTAVSYNVFPHQTQTI